MSKNKIDLKSSTVDKAIDLAKEFASKLISPTIEEVGLLLSDNIKYFRFKNQVKILLKAKKYVDEKNIHLKEIPIKILVPLLENASLEDDDTIQEKWANLLANMADSSSNLQNQIFPFVLSQISKDEYFKLKNLYDEEVKFQELKSNLDDFREINMKNRLLPNDIDSEKWVQIEYDIYVIEQRGFKIILEDYEIDNILRLSLITKLPPKIILEGKPLPYYKLNNIKDNNPIEYDMTNYGYRISQLGKKFIEVCEKKIKPVGNNV